MPRTKKQTLPSQFEIQEGGSHYKNLPIQPMEYCQKNKLGAIESSVVKYVTRHEEKGRAQDLKKAIHLLQMQLEMDYDIRSKIEYGE